MVTVLAPAAGIDLLTGGALNKFTRKAAVRAVKAIVPTAARFGARAGVSVAGTALGMGRLALMNPYVLGGTAIYVAYHERDKIRNLLEQGYEIVEERLPPAPSLPRPSLPSLPAFPTPGIPMPSDRFPIGRRKKSSFNKAVGAGMLAVKGSTSYGKKGKITSPKKAFSMVTKVAASVKKKLKAPKKGIRKKVYSVVKRFL